VLLIDPGRAAVQCDVLALPQQLVEKAAFGPEGEGGV
jgi:hypothetical protein